MSKRLKCAGGARMGGGRRPLGLAITAALALCAGFSSPAAPAVSNWSGDASSDWNKPGNWNVVPTSAGSVLVDTTSPHATQLTGGAVTTSYLTVGGAAQGSLTINGGTLRVTGSDANELGATVGRDAGSQGSVTVTGSGSVLTVDAGMQLGNAGTGSLSVLNGGTANLGLFTAFSETVVGLGYYGFPAGVESGKGTITVDGGGSTVNYAGGLNLLNGALTITDGGLFLGQTRAMDGNTFWLDVLGFGTPAYPTLGRPELSGSAEVSITGAGSQWASGNALVVGQGGMGTLSILEGGKAGFKGFVELGMTGSVFDQNQIVASKAGSASVLVSGAGSSLSVTAAPSGTNGGVGYLTVGEEGPAQLVIDHQAEVSVADGAVVGGKSHGEVSIASGGALLVHGSDSNGIGMTLGRDAGAQGDVTVTGSGSTVTVDAGMQVGNAGTGSLSVVDGGTANLGLSTAYSETVVGLGYYGLSSGVENGTGAVTVDGSGSTINYAGGFNLLDGSLTITNGGHLLSQTRTADGNAFWFDTVGFGTPASADGSHAELSGLGEVTISGAGSQWISVHGMGLGGGGTGTLSILDGGKASFAGMLTDENGQISGSKAGMASVLVSGADSSLGVVAAPDGLAGGAGNMTLGESGNTSLKIEQQGQVTLAGTLVVGGKSQGDVSIASGGTLTVGGSGTNGTGAILGRDAGSQGDLTVTGSGSVLTVDAGMQVGNAGTGSLSVLNGGTANLSLSTAYTETLVGLGYYGFPNGAESGTGEVTIDGSGSTINYAGGFNLLDGSLTITNGGQLLSQTRAADITTPYWQDLVGFGTPAQANWNHPELAGSGEVTISGAGSQWTSVNGLGVGYGGTGMLSILDGGKAGFAGAVDLGSKGYLTDANGQVVGTKTGTAIALVSGTGSGLSVVAAPAGTNGGSGRLSVGEDGAASLAIEQQGEVSLAGTLVVGGKSEGEVSITSGGTLAVGGIDANGIGATLGRDAGSQGDLTVTGSGSVLTVDAGMQVGNSGTGTLSVLNGGTANLGLATAYSETVVGLGYYGLSSGAENGTGAVTVDGSGSTINYAGGFNLLDGSLTITNGGQLLSRTRSADGNAFWLDMVGFGTPASADGSHAELNGSGEVTISGAGSQWISVNGLALGQGGTSTLSILDGGKASFVGMITDENGQISGTKLGTASVLVSGSGSTLSVVAGNAGSGSTKGVINLGLDGHSSLQVSDGGAVSAADSIQIGEMGSLTVGSGIGDQLAGGVATPYVTVDGRLAFNHGSPDYTFASAIGGGGSIDVSSGFTMLTGDGGAFMGNTQVFDGATLSVNGSLGGSVSVSPGGRLQGTGTIGSANIGGTLAPGNSPGTLYLTGDLLMRDTSVYEAQMDTIKGVSDSVVVAGNVTIQPGATLKVENIGGGVLKPGDSLQLIRAGGAVDGQFALVDDPLSPFLGYGLTYGNGGITVGVTRSALSFASVGTTPTERAVGQALDSLPNDSPLATVVYGQLDTSAKAATAIHQLPGLFAADNRRVMLDDSRLPRDAVLGRLQHAADLAEASAVWVQGMGYWGSTDADAGEPGAKSNGSGMMLGTDVGVGSVTRLGVAAGFGQTSYRMAEQHASAHIKGSHLAIYGRTGLGALGLSYGAAYSWSKMGSNRSFDIGTARQQLNGDHDARTGQVFADMGYRLGGSTTRYLEPFISAAYVKLDDDGWKEVGTAAALATRGGSASATFGTLGLRWSAATASARLFGTVGWRHVFGFEHATAQQSFVSGGNGFLVQSLPLAKDAAVLDVGTDFAIGKHARVTFAYSGLLASSSRDSGGRIQFAFDF